jgi:hypothetical protein
MSLMDLLRRECSKLGLVAALSLSGCSNTIVKTVYVYPETASAVGDGYIDSSLPEVSKPEVSVDVPVPEEASSVVEEAEISEDVPFVGDSVEVNQGDISEPDLPEEVSSTLDSLVQDTGDNIRYLDGCKTSGWEDGKTYVLTGDVVATIKPNQSCFKIENGKDITFDGGNYTVNLNPEISLGPYIIGVYVIGGTNIFIKNFNVITKKGYSFFLKGTNGAKFSEIIASGSDIGIVIGDPNQLLSTQYVNLNKITCKDNLISGLYIDKGTSYMIVNGLDSFNNDEGVRIVTNGSAIEIINSKIFNNMDIGVRDGSYHSEYTNLSVTGNAKGFLLSGAYPVLNQVTSCDNKYYDIDCGGVPTSAKINGLTASKIDPLCGNKLGGYALCGKP